MNQISHKQNFYIFIASAVVIYFLIYIPMLNVPFNSDDYNFFLQGLSLKNRWALYMTWSGRLITDFTSSYLLNLFSLPVYTAINSFVFLTFLVVISLLPFVVIKTNPMNQKSYLVLWFIFMTYWVANPRLGHTSFWLVGSANYIWPLMWASFYLLYILYLLGKQQELNYKQTILLSILGIFAGLSNEATGISVVFFTFILFFVFKSKENKKIVLTGFITTLIGFLVLYLAPGNSVRLYRLHFSSWNDLSLFEQFCYHICHRMPRALLKYWFVVLLIILLFYTIKKIDTKKIFDKKYYTFIFTFFILAFFSVLVFIKSPVMPPRALNTGLFYLLLALSFLSTIIITLDSKKCLRSLYIALSVTVLYFIPSYTYFTYAVLQTNIQQKIIENIIKEDKQNNLKEITIPDWYFDEVLKKNRSGDMPKYYGVENIIWTPATFNYAIIKEQEPITVNLQLKDNLQLTSIFYINNLIKKDELILEFNKSLLPFTNDGDDTLFIHLYMDNKNEFVKLDIKISKFTQIGEKYYYHISSKNLDLNKIDKIEFGFYNSNTKQNSASFSLDFKKLFLKH